MRPLRSTRALGALSALLVLLALAPGVAQACILNNTASLYANGVQAAATTANAAGGGPWAPFTIEKAFASAAPVQFSEARSDLARSLSAYTLARPFRWVFGDGAAVLGHTATHRYARPGLYRLMVYGFDVATRSWFPFDNALVRIVPPDQVLQANLGYYALRALDVVMSGAVWLFDAACAAVLLAIVVKALRRRRIGPGHTAVRERVGGG